MSNEETSKPVGDGDLSKSGADGSDMVAYKTYSRALDQKKEAERQAESLKSEIDALRAEKAENEGNKDEALQTWKERATKAEEREKSLKASIAQKEVETNVKQALMQAGCKKPDVALRVMDDKDYNTLFSDVNENFVVGEQTLNFVIDKLKRETSDIGLFGKSAPKIVDGVPSNGEVGKPKSARELALKKVNEAKTSKEYDEALKEAMKHF